MKKTKEKAAAVLTIYDAAAMTPRERSDIAKWLHDRARDIETEGPNFSSRFTARYLCKA